MNGHPITIRPGPWWVLCLSAMLLSGCSIKKAAINMLGDALAQSGTVFASDDDPELVRDAIPFSLKLMESLLVENPDHQGLLLASSSYFTQYAYAFVQQDADRVDDEDFDRAETIRKRALRLYLRARRYGLQGLEMRHPGFTNALNADPRMAVQVMKKKDAPQLYWAFISWAGAISLSKDDPFLIAEIPKMEALVDRCLALDEAFGQGAIHSFLITYEMSRQGTTDDPVERSRHHFKRAMELNQGSQIAPLLALAEAVSIKQQNLQEFESLLNQALALNPDEYPDNRLVNLIMQQRAQWLLSRKDDLFLIEGKE